MKRRGDSKTLLAVILIVIVFVALIGVTAYYLGQISTTTTSSSSTTMTTSSSSSSSSGGGGGGGGGGGPQTYTVVTSSAPTSQWLILNCPCSSVQLVSANDTGTVPQFTTLSALNSTIIGERCITISSDACTSWQNLNQTGWFYDSSSTLLYIHYLGGAVSISVTYVQTSQVAFTGFGKRPAQI